MKNKKIIYKNFFPKKHLNLKFNKKFNSAYFKNLENIKDNLDTPKDMFHSFSKKFKLNFKAKDINRFKQYKTVVTIGMGGSILGSEAIYSFLGKKIKKIFLFLNDIDKEKLDKIKSKKNLNKILFIIISKSGNTIETLSNTFALKIIKKNAKNIIIISEKKNNPLYLMSKKMKLYHIEHKNYIGGRFSVLSEVGMMPACLMGVNIGKIRKNLLIHFNKKNQIFLKQSSIALANLIKNNKFRNLIFFNYVPQLNKFLYWCQQLMAESLGKKGIGFLPSVSQAPKDHHSLLQLYLDGPRDKIFYIFKSETIGDQNIKIKNIDKNLNFLNNKSLSQIKSAQTNAFIRILKKKNIPFRVFQIKDFNETTLGELFSYFMIETAIIGKLLNINPFDQPAVEEVKISTKKLLR